MPEQPDSGYIISVTGLETYRALTDAFADSYKPALAAELLAARHATIMVCINAATLAALAPLHQRYGLRLWRDQTYHYMTGTMAAFRALLVRWPHAADPELGAALAQALGVPFRLALEVPWLGAAPEGWGQGPVLMGIVNVTPDSFSDGGQFSTPSTAVRHALQLVAAGASILDIGGESTRPGAAAVPIAEELNRVLPVIRAVARETQTPISIDTYKPEVAEAALESGATIVNDITGLTNPKMTALVAKTGVPAIIMHMQGTPQTMQDAPVYEDVMADVLTWLDKAGQQAIAAGVRPEQIIIDPGVGFGKTVEHNLEILARSGDFLRLGYPVLIGASRKSVVGKVLNLPVTDRREGTAATVAMSVLQGADIIRVHDVEQMRRVSIMTQAMLRRG
ncbi:MAG: dihydropteroate synthase [Limnochordia bacterium]